MHDIEYVPVCACGVPVEQWASSYLCTYYLYSPVHKILDACISITTRASGRGLGPGNREFFGPRKMASSLL